MEAGHCEILLGYTGILELYSKKSLSRVEFSVSQQTKQRLIPCRNMSSFVVKS